VLRRIADPEEVKRQEADETCVMNIIVPCRTQANFFPRQLQHGVRFCGLFSLHGSSCFHFILCRPVSLLPISTYRYVFTFYIFYILHFIFLHFTFYIFTFAFLHFYILHFYIFTFYIFTFYIYFFTFFILHFYIYISTFYIFTFYIFYILHCLHFTDIFRNRSVVPLNFYFVRLNL
jgi:hypothetical protein